MASVALLSVATTSALALAQFRVPATHPRAAVVANLDPFRPARPPLEPLLINAVQELLLGELDAAAVAERAVAARAADPDYTLTEDEVKLLTQRVERVGAARGPLEALLAAIVDGDPSIRKYGMEKDYGVGDVADPYVRACRAECMLALLLLHVEALPVDFIDEDRLELLDCEASAEVEAVRDAVR